MTLIALTKNHEDLSTDKGYQFKFHCDKCGNGYMTSFNTSVIGTAGAFLRAAGDVFGGGLSGAGYGAYEVQRAVGGPQHDAAFKAAVEECKQHFCQCRNCGLWVCPEVCWNPQAGQCKGCAPDFQQQMVSAHAQAKADAARSQMQSAAQKQDYVGGVDMSANAVYHAPAPAGPPPYGPATPPNGGVGMQPYDPYRQPAQPPYGAPQGQPWSPPGYPQQQPPYGQAPYAPPPQQGPAVANLPGTATPVTALPCAQCHRPTGGVKFCEECGTPRTTTCANCNQALHAGAKFCGTCGAHI